ncbi:hypothetical protein [Nocardiopsis suaedae]|uniref:Uncharacterized protein n=1 Tax=Nocardiopsis suaedae TaxID=3018444 RepID=A0ABT4TEQ4_9ACTN|nr:hypothetical protein [Nocardiopsis suaedae]MDA2803183.1 hypothetical protein [Nocardiopsis suaedae]
METQNPPSGRPSPEEAAAALQETEKLTTDVAGVKVPAWYFPVLGAVVAPYGLITVLPDTPLGIGATFAGIAAFLAAVALIAHFGVKQMGVLRWLTWKETWPVFVPCGVLTAAALAASTVIDSNWLWVGLSAALGVIIAGFGPYHRRTSPYYRQSDSQ